MTFVTPPFVSEREERHLWPGHVWDNAADEDCVFCSGLMLVLANTPGAGDATLMEAERLRRDAGLGHAGGASAADLIRGVKQRYGITLTPVAANAAALWAALTPGMGAVVLGKLSYFPKGHSLRRFIPGWEGGHAVFVERRDTLDRVWWMDPEGAPIGTYRGEWVSKTQLLNFVRTYSGHAVAPLAVQKEEIAMAFYEKTGNGGNFKVAVGKTAVALKMTANGFEPAGPTAKSGSGTYDFTYRRTAGTKTDLAPDYVHHIKTGPLAGYFVKAGDVDEANYPAPVVFTQADLDAAKASAAAAAAAPLNARIAAAKTALA